MTIYSGHIDGNVVILAGDDASGLTSVGGSLIIYADASLPALASVGGGLAIYADASLPALTSVAGHDLPDAATARQRLADVARAALQPGALNMDAWHTCGTTHCAGGWSIVQAGEKGKRLEAEHDSLTAANILLGVEGSKLFFLSNDQARAALEAVLEEA